MTTVPHTADPPVARVGIDRTKLFAYAMVAPVVQAPPPAAAMPACRAWPVQTPVAAPRSPAAAAAAVAAPAVVAAEAAVVAAAVVAAASSSSSAVPSVEMAAAVAAPAVPADRELRAAPAAAVAALSRSSLKAVLSSAIPPQGKLLAIINGAYGQRISAIAKRHGIEVIAVTCKENERPDLAQIERALRDHPDLDMVAIVHCETTSGIINPIEEVGRLVENHKATYFVDSCRTRFSTRLPRTGFKA